MKSTGTAYMFVMGFCVKEPRVRYDINMSNNALVLSPGADLASYIRTVNSFKALSAEKEKQLAEKLFYDNDVAAARQLVMSQLRYVVSIARGYNGYGLQQADLIQEGNVGLMKAVKRFDPNRGVRLITFAAYWIKAEIHEFILRNWRIVSVATTKAQRKLFFNLRSAKKRLGWMGAEEKNALAEKLDVMPEEVQRMEQRLYSSDTSFDPIQADDSSEIAPANYIADDDSNPADIIEAENYREMSHQSLQHALEQLDERSMKVIKRRWLTNSKATLHELADELGVSAERVRQIEKRALGKLKDHMPELQVA